MIKARYIEKFKDKQGRIIGYRLEDENGLTKDFKSEDIKQNIRSGNLEVINLKLTTDNRLIDRKEKATNKPVKQYTLDEEVRIIVTKAKMLGLPIRELTSYQGGNTYLISKDNMNHIWVIPSGVKRIVEDYKFSVVENVTGHLKVVGGSGLTSDYNMFYRCEVETIDLSGLDTSKVTDMSDMFHGCKAENIDLSSFDTSKVEDMEGMFYGCKAENIDLSSFNTSKVTDMSGMFDGCEAKIKATDPVILAEYENI